MAAELATLGAPTPAAEVAAAVRELIATGRVAPFSAVAIIRAAARAGASWDAVEDVVATIAKGADGIGGTADDLIPMSTLAMLTSLLHNGVVRDLVTWVLELTGGGGAEDAPGTEPAQSQHRAVVTLKKLWRCVLAKLKVVNVGTGGAKV